MRGTTLSELATGTKTILGRAVTEAETRAFQRYIELIQAWNAVHRLVGSSDESWIVENVILDSLLFLELLPQAARRIVDIGSGVGVPGVPMSVVRPDLAITLVESRQKRASFLSTTVRELGLTQVRVVPTRAESLSGAGFDAAVARCAGAVDRVLALAGALLRSGGVLVISGPPKPAYLPGVEWRDVPGWRPGSTRRFGLAVVP
jgi:16S rRNA (guanine527-N7)-methyltransferase